MDYKQKYLKYKQKYLELLKDQIGGEIIDELIHETETIQLIEKPEDIEEVLCIDKKPGCIKCKICKSVSGDLRIIPHNFSCKYNERNIYDPIIKGNRIISTSFMNSSISVAILQREYGIVNTMTQKKIIYSYAAGPCIVLCMHDISSQRAILGHIDTLTIDPLNKFRTFLPENCDVYIVGGDNSTKSLINTILKQLKSRNYKIKFAYIKDNYTSNSFGINCMTGETYLNDSVIEYPLSHEEEQRLSNFTRISTRRSELNRVNIT
jgi:hypothetical protein